MTQASPPATEDRNLFTVDAIWSGDGMGCGKVRLPQGELSVPIAGSKSLGGCGVGTNPEELLVAAVAACFINTWAIFLKKLDIAYAEPAVRATGTLGKDPAGGYKMLDMVLYARVPSSLMAAQRAQIEKTLALSEKYCIISKVAKAAMPVKVEVEEV